MITEQIINYIKDQIKRGMPHEKIRSNLLAAGWIEEDIKQAFSFANPDGQNAALKIAPSFAVEDPIVKESPVDKTEVTAGDKPYIPVLKRDEKPLANNIHPSDESLMTMVKTEQSLAGSPKTIDDDFLRKVNEFNNQPKNFKRPDSIQNKNSSGFLKSLVVVLVLILIIGNAFVWFVYPKYTGPIFSAKNNEQMLIQDNINEFNQEDRTVENQDVDSLNSSSNISIIKDLLNEANFLKTASIDYFSKNNSYGSTAIKLSNCGISGTIFVDPLVRKSLENITTITNNIPKCSLESDDDVKKNRMTSYLVYVPVGDMGYCIDSQGASLMVGQEPQNTSCLSSI